MGFSYLPLALGDPGLRLAWRRAEGSAARQGAQHGKGAGTPGGARRRLRAAFR